MEFFVPPADADEWFRYWIDERLALVHALRDPRESLRVRAHDADELSHYSSATSDIEYLYPIGWSELEGIANRGDVRPHRSTRRRPAPGSNGSTAERRAVHPARDRAGARRQPVDARVPLRRLPRGGRRRARAHGAAPPPRDRAGEGRRAAAHPARRGRWRRRRARSTTSSAASWSPSTTTAGQIGRRYRRQDEIGTPWALTIDEQTLADDTVTVRDRDSLAQERISIARAREYLLDRLGEPWAPPAAG